MHRTAITLGAVAVASTMILGGCASSSDDDAGSDRTTAASKDRYATILDTAVSALGDDLPAVSVALGSASVDFADGDELHIALSGYGKGFDYSAPEFTAAGDLSSEYGVDIDQFDPAGDPQKQITQVQDAIASGKYNAMIVYPLSTDLMCDLMTKQMPAAGIIPVAIGNPPCTESSADGVLTVVPDTGGTDYVYPAWADIIAEREKGGRAILLTGSELDFTTQIATSSLQKSFKANGISIEAVQRTDFTQEDSLQKAQDILQAHPDVTTVVSSYPEGTSALVTALKQAGLSDKVTVYDFGGDSRILEEIEQGEVDGSSPFYPYTKTKTAIQALLLARAGEKIDPLMPYAGHSVESMRTEGEDIMFITKDNVDAFHSDVAEY
jgi:ribose transport system substrate-binding protein